MNYENMTKKQLLKILRDSLKMTGGFSNLSKEQLINKIQFNNNFVKNHELIRVIKF